MNNVASARFELAYLEKVDIRTLITGDVFECRPVQGIDGICLKLVRSEVKINSGTTSLFIEVNGSQSTIEEYESIGRGFRDLLSIAIGRNLHFESILYLLTDKKSTSEHRVAVKTYNAGYQIIPTVLLNPYLSKVSENYFAMPEEIRKLFWLITDHLNNTHDGYLEDRVQRVTQAWEIFAILYGKIKSLDSMEIENLEKKRSSDELDELNELLQEQINEWSIKYKELQGRKSPENVKSRIVDAIQRIGITEKLTSILNELGIKHENVQRVFVNIFRHRVEATHRGLIREANKETVLNELEEPIFILQLILLNLLGYVGAVVDYRDAYRIKPMSQFFVNH